MLVDFEAVPERVGHIPLPVTVTLPTGVEVLRFTWPPILTWWLNPLRCRLILADNQI